MATSKKRNPATHIESSKIDAKLRMIANANQQVNEIRAEFSGNVAIRANRKPSQEQVLFENPAEQPKPTGQMKKKMLNRPPKDILTNVFIELSPSSNLKVEGEITRRGNLVSARLPLTRLKEVSERKDVIGMENARMLKFTDPLVNNNYAGQPRNHTFDQLRKAYPPKHETLIGIIDVGGFDFAHPDFLDAKGNTRFLKIWDQGSSFRKSPKKFKYGAEFDKKDLDKAIKNAPAIGVPATSIEKQSQESAGSHATHVTSIAAGNSGVFPYAGIVGVTIALKDSDFDRRKSFYDSSCLVHAIEYILDFAKEKGCPVAINISLGTNGHAHDGSDVTSRWIDGELSLPGRCITIATGNAGQEKPLSSTDYGYIMGRIHAGGRIEATGLSKDLAWNVVGNGIADISENELEIWYAPQDRLSVMVKPPGMDWIGPIEQNEFIENKQLEDSSFISIYNDLYHFSNGSNYIGIYLSPNFNPQAVIPVRAGTWHIRLKGKEIKDGTFDCWIERDDPRPLGPNGAKEAWNFPSFFAEKTNVDNTSISSLACARYVIAVGNYDSVNETINISSSQGPTRDKRNKPEVIAPGTNITAAKGFSAADDLWIAMTGTSMASPYVCGIAAWMLSLDKDLTAAQVQGIIIRTSNPLPGLDYNWKNDTGFGFIDPKACLEDAKYIRDKKDVTDAH